MRPLLERLAAGERLVCDGAMGTLLFARGLEAGRPPETVTLERPTVLEEIARLYLEAGADILETNTFGGSPLRLALHGLDAETERVNRVAVEAVRRVAGDRAHVAGSVGPSGRLLEPYGDVSAEVVADSFQRQITVLADAGVDCLIIETMTDLAEATIAIRAAKETAPALPVLATMTFDPTPRGYFTIMGVSVAAAVAGLVEAGADVVGANCGTGSAAMVEIAREFRRHTQRPLLIQPNAGLPHAVGGRVQYDESPEFVAANARALLAVGVAIVGGCCGTTPEHIAALRAAVAGFHPGA